MQYIRYKKEKEQININGEWFDTCNTRNVDGSLYEGDNHLFTCVYKGNGEEVTRFADLGMTIFNLNVEIDGEDKGDIKKFVFNDYNYHTVKFYGTFISSLDFTNVIDLISIILIKDPFIFKNCTNLIKVILPSNIQVILDEMFYNCTNLKIIEIPNSVVTIEGDAFNSCTSLTSITIPNSVTKINSFAFAACTNLENIVLSDNLNTIGAYAFYNCYNLTNIIIPNNVSTLNNDLFYNCTNLENVTLGSGVKTVETNVFTNCYSLTSITSYAKTAPTLPQTINFSGLPKNGILKVPSGSDYSSWKNQLPSGWAIEYF